MNRNRIVIGEPNNPIFVFENDQLRQVDVVLRSSYSGDELAYDQLNASTFAGEAWDLASNEGDDLYSSEDFQLVSNPADITGDIPAGTPVRYYVNDNLVGKFYAQPATRENRLVYDITAISAIGLLSKQAHKGGLYNGETFAEVATDIIGGAFTFSCSPDVGSIPIVGWAPYNKDARENLHDLLFSYGVMVFKDEAGDVYFDFANTNFRKTISADKTYRNGSITPVEPAALVRITEHQFFTTADDLEYTLFDNNGGTTADNQLVLFDHAPIYALTASGGLTINENGVNYAIVSGNGTLTGKSYTHTQEVYESGTPGGSTIEITNQTFINQLNSISVARRLLNYYGVTETLTTDIQVEDEKPGQLVDITNPYNERVWAYISEMTITGLATAKARCQMLANFTPTKGGNNYNEYELLTANGTWIVPDGVTMIRAQIGGGGQAGYNGGRGQNGTTGNTAADNPGKGGEGGTKGLGGAPGKVAAFNIVVSPGDVVTVTIGAGGQMNGEEGVASTLIVNGTTYTSADGDIPENGIINQFTGDVYALYGPDGQSGAPGGDAETNGGDIETWHGGDPGNELTWGGETGEGGGGGGAAIGSDGNDGNDAHIVNGYVVSGDGGDGADATATTFSPALSSGGHGGHGGGGGGGGGKGQTDSGRRKYGLYGTGGLGSAGTPGCAGFVNIMY